MKNYEIFNSSTAPESTRSLLDGVEKSMGLVPNLLGIMATSKPVLSSYLALSDFFSKTSLSPIEQQVVLLSVSKENECGYCLAAHSMLARNIAKMDAQTIEQLKTNAPIENPKLNALAVFTRHVVATRGNVSDLEITNFLSQGYDQRQILEVILGVSMKTLSNYINHIAKTPIDDAFLSK